MWDKIFYFFFDSEYIISIFISIAIFGIHLKKRKYFVIPALITFALGVLAWRLLYFLDSYVYLIVALIIGIGILFTFDLNFFQGLFLLTAGYSLQHIIYKITISFVFIFGGNNIWHSYYYFLIYFLTCLVCLPLIYYFVSRRFIKDQTIYVNNISILLLTAVILMTAIVLSYITQNQLLEINNVSLFIEVNIYAIILCALGIGLLFYNASNIFLSKENEILEQVIKKDEARYELAKRNAEAINIKYHDLKHQLIHNTLDEEAKKELEKDAKVHESLFFTGNKALDIVLNEKKQLLDEKNISFLVMAKGEILNQIKAYQIYSLFGNLIDNAIEGLKEIEDVDERFIKININSYKDNILISQENYTNNKIKFVNGLPVTTKTDKENHGYGTKSIKAIIDSYDGQMKMSLNNNIFKVTILIPIKENQV